MFPDIWGERSRAAAYCGIGLEKPWYWGVIILSYSYDLLTAFHANPEDQRYHSPSISVMQYINYLIIRLRVRSYGG